VHYPNKRPDAPRLASEEHQAIIDAIIAGDGDAAFNPLMDHVSLSNELFSDLAAALSAADAKPQLDSAKLRPSQPRQLSRPGE
jgi:DNA-binding FadR family transcriptional regulator